MPIVDPEDRELTISCGAALFNLRVALRHFSYADEVEVLAHQDAPDVLARVRMGRARQATEEDHQLFQAIAHRRTNRQVFERREVPPALLTTLSELAASPSAKCERGPAALNTFLPGLC